MDESKALDGLYGLFHAVASGLEDPISALGGYGLCHKYIGTVILTEDIEKHSGYYRKRKTSVLPIDTENFTTPDADAPNLRVPTMERALIDCIRMVDEVDEGLMTEAFGDYEARFAKENIDKLYEVADFYNVPRSDVDFWLQEGKEYY